MTILFSETFNCSHTLEHLVSLSIGRLVKLLSLILLALMEGPQKIWVVEAVDAVGGQNARCKSSRITDVCHHQVIRLLSLLSYIFCSLWSVSMVDHAIKKGCAHTIFQV